MLHPILGEKLVLLVNPNVYDRKKGEKKEKNEKKGGLHWIAFILSCM